MSKETLEHLSSLMDGELSRETGLFLVRRLGSDRELGQVWQRYHLIRDCMRQPGGRFTLVNFSQRMRQALESEGGQHSSATRVRAWLRPVGGLAIAASVALLAVIAVGPTQPAGQQAATAAARPFTAPNVLPAVPGSQAVSFNPAEQARKARLNSYLLRHNQLAGTVGRQGFVSFVPIISSSPGTDAAAEANSQVNETANPESEPSTP